MALDDQDLRAIAHLLDERLARERADAGRRRRFWIALAVLLGVSASAVGAVAIKRVIGGFQDAIVDHQRLIDETRAAYQQELARSRDLRRERDEASERSGYRPDRKPAQREADLIAGAIRLFNQSKQAQEAARDLGGGDLDDLEKMAERYQAVLGGAADMAMRLLLENSEAPAPGARPARDRDAHPAAPGKPLVEVAEPAER